MDERFGSGVSGSAAGIGSADRKVGGELTVKESGILDVIKETGIGEVIKPLTQEIHLFDSYVAGTSYVPNQAALQELKAGETLKLLRENNKFDDNAINILREDGTKIGYVPEKDNVVFARLLDAGKMLSAKITTVEHKGTFTKVGISIYLVDF